MVGTVGRIGWTNPMSDLFSREFLFVVGKGGVGKTTVSAALALSAARRGKKVLIAMCNAKERLSHLLEVDEVGPRNQPLFAGIEAVNMKPNIALEEYAMMILKARSLYKAVFENRFVEALLRGTPGIEAWSMLGKAYFHTEERNRDGSPRYDLVIMDAPATGHALDMLRVPRVISEVAPGGPLRTEAEKALALLRDPARTGGVLVSLPEDMPVNETMELHKALTEEIQLPVSQLVINSVLPKLFKASERDAIVELANQVEPDSPLAGLTSAARERAQREGLQSECISRLRKALPDLPRVILPHLHTHDFRRASVQALSEAL